MCWSWFLLVPWKAFGELRFFCAPWARHQHSRCSFALYCVFCKVFCGTSRLSSVGVQWGPCCEPGLQGRGQEKGRTSVQGEHLQSTESCTEPLTLCRQEQPIRVGCPHVLPGKQGVWGKCFKAEIITGRTWSCMFPWHNFPWRSRELRVSRELDSPEFS